VEGKRGRKGGEQRVIEGECIGKKEKKER
jgi:hypothetical protein